MAVLQLTVTRMRLKRAAENRTVSLCRVTIRQTGTTRPVELTASYYPPQTLFRRHFVSGFQVSVAHRHKREATRPVSQTCFDGQSSLFLARFEVLAGNEVLWVVTLCGWASSYRNRSIKGSWHFHLRGQSLKGGRRWRCYDLQKSVSTLPATLVSSLKTRHVNFLYYIMKKRQVDEFQDSGHPGD